MIYCTKISFRFFDGIISVMSTGSLFSNSESSSVSANNILFEIYKSEKESDLRFDEYRNSPILLAENRDYYIKITFDNPKEVLQDRYVETVDVNTDNTQYTFRFNSKNYVGLLNLRFLGIQNFMIEVESLKINYHDEYNNLILKITGLDTDLISRARSIFENRAQTSERLDRSSNFLNSKLSFLRSKILNGDFQNLYNAFLRKPIRRITTTVYETYPWNADNIDLDAYFTSILENSRIKSSSRQIPQKISTIDYEDDINTVENQFLKYVLEYIIKYLDDALKIAKNNNIENLVIDLAECLSLCNDIFANPFFRGISKLGYFPSKSNVLQSKYPYREIFNIYILLFYEIEICDDRVNETLSLPIKDLPKLYEYWCFISFVELLNIEYGLPDNFSTDFISYDDQSLSYLIKLNNGGLHYKIDKTKHIVLNYQKSYLGRNYIYEGRSYSHNLDPDISIELFIDDKLAAIIHFDAKYRLDNLESFKNEDIDKMHTYKDAILGSIGAYILYPGKATANFVQEEKDMIATDQIFPSVGAFVYNIRDSNETSEQNAILKMIRSFIEIEESLDNKGIFTKEQKIYNYKKRLID